MIGTMATVLTGYAVQEAGIAPSGDTRVVVTGYDLAFVPTTLDEYLALPEHETAVCPRCDGTGVMMHRDLCRCAACGYRWRWPAAVGMD